MSAPTPITVIGIPREWDNEAINAIRSADIIIGSQRQYDSMLAGVQHDKSLMIQAQHVSWVGGLDAVIAQLKHATSPVVLASGDPGYFGIVRKLIVDSPAPIRVFPAPSSIARAFAKLGLTWDDATVVSAHGRTSKQAIAMARSRHKVAIFTDANITPHQIADYVSDLPKDVWVIAALEERYEQIGLFDNQAEWPQPNIVIVVDKSVHVPNAKQFLPEGSAYSSGLHGVAVASTDESDELNPKAVHQLDAFPKAVKSETEEETDTSRPSIFAGGYTLSYAKRVGLPESQFRYRNQMITKSPIRTFLSGCLQAQPGVVLWDLGCGSGAVSVEAALTGACVYALDTDPLQIRRTQENAQAHHVPIGTFVGSVADAPANWLHPDVVYLGGGGIANVQATLDTFKAEPIQTIVATYASIQTFTQAMAMLQEHGYAVTAQQIAASIVQALPNGTHRMEAQNPIFVMQAILRDDKLLYEEQLNEAYAEVVSHPGLTQEDIAHKAAQYFGQWVGTSKQHTGSMAGQEKPTATEAHE